jgi:DNA polymerase-1
MPTPQEDLELWDYNCRDCVNTREVGEVLLASIDKLGLGEVDAFQQRLFWPVLAAMNRGVRIDLDKRRELDRLLEAEKQKRIEYFNYVLGHSINIDSPKQMMALFYEDLAQQPIMSKATKASPSHVTCNDDALIKIARREPLLKPLVQAIQEYRTIRVILSTFIRMKLDYDNRMRCSYNICGTETYRFNSRENAFGTGGNLQNVPKGGPEDEYDLLLPNVREMFVPDQGYTFFDTDLSKADLRIVVWESDCREMKAMLAEGRDPYIEAARECFRDPTINKKLPDGNENPKYTKFKSMAHGTNYLGTPQGLAMRLGLLVHEVERVQNWYFGKYPQIKEWQHRFAKEITRTRRVQNKFGYVRQYFDRVDDAMIREAIAWLPQSTVACLINRVWLNLYDNVPDVQVLLQVHDSLAGQFPTHLADKLKPEMLKQAEITIPYEDPLVIPIGLKTSEKSWGDCE